MDDVFIEQGEMPGAGACRRPSRPDTVRLMEWPGPDTRPEEIESRSIQAATFDAVDVTQWVHTRRSTDPTRTLVVLEERRADGRGGVGWDRVAEVVSRLEDRTAGFIGDTTPTSLAGLREWTNQSLPDGVVTAGTRGDIVLVVDELASNVEEHAPGWLTVDLVLADDHVLVVVSDPHPDRVPVAREAPPDQAHGRGLFLVGALSERWGMVVTPTSKAVWAEIARTERSSGSGEKPAMLEVGHVPVDTGRAADGAVV